MKKTLLIWAILIAVIYLAISFVEINLNPLLWPKGERFVFIILIIVGFFLSFFIEALLEKE